VHLGLGDPTGAVSDLKALVEAPVQELPPEVHAGALRRMAAARQRMGEFNEALKHLQTARQVLALGPLTAPVGGNGEPRPALPGVTLEMEREAWAIELAMAQVMVEMRDQNQRARDQAEQVLRGLDRRRHPELAAETLNLLGRLARLQGDLEQATQLVRESLALYQAYGNRSGAAAAYANLGVLAANKREMETAYYSHFALSLGLREALGDSLGIAISRNNLGQLERNRGRFAQAIQQLTRAADRARHAEAAPLLAQCLSNLGQAQTLAGQHEAALATYDAADLVCNGYGLKTGRLPGRDGERGGGGADRGGRAGAGARADLR
jgi:tetratricopeptide (TPR) repeat protein